MYLKKLSVQGFKSFANRTSFDYGPGITAVVGPNGSGKSNVADAIRWVLGEQSTRLLRARKQEDVIFSGARDRSAVGMAEVILTLDNEDRWLPVDFAEVEVGRRVYRNGDSEYLLNGSRVRLRDIVDLLMKGDVGQNSYTIMGQGLVDEVLSMTPDERRGFLDEAADVKRFRMKTKEAQDRLAATRENIDRVSLIVSEIEPQLSRLERQAERAAEHRRLSAELADLLRVFYVHRWSEAQNALARARAALDQRVAEGSEAAERVEQLREQLRTLGEEIRKRREAITRRDQRHGEIEARIAASEHAIAIDRERHAMTHARHEEVRLEVEALEAERVNLASAGVDEGKRGLEINEDSELLKAQLAAAREGLELAEREYSAVRSRVQELRDGADADDRRVAAVQQDTTRTERRVIDLDRELEQVLARRKGLLVELIGYGRRFAEVRAQVIEAEDQIDRARAEAAQARDRLNRVQDEVRDYEAAGNQELRELDHLEGRLDALRRVQAEHDGVAAGTRNALIMGQALIDGVEPGSLGEPPEISGMLGLLSRHVKVPAGMELAVNAALEYRLHAVITETESQAIKAVDLLRNRRQGRAQFLPLESVRHVYPLNLQKERGVVGVAAKLVRCEAKFRPLVDTLLGRVIICDDMEAALRMIRRGLGSVVTLDGTCIEPTGVVTGGATAVDESTFSRQRELEDLPLRIQELRERTAVQSHQLETARATIEQLARRSHEADGNYEVLRRLLDSSQADLARERERLLRLHRELDGVRSRRTDIERERASCERELAEASTSIAELQARRDDRRAAMADLEADLKAATDRREVALAAVSEASARQAAVEGERKALELMRIQHEKSVERLAGQISARRLQLRNLELEGNVIEERLGKLQRELEAARTEQARYSDDAAPDRDELHRFEGHERTIQEEYNQSQSQLLAADRQRLDLEAEVARFEEQISSLRAELEREGLALDRGGAVVPLDQAATVVPLFESPRPAIQGAADIDVEETRRRIEDVRRQIRRLGPVNEEALDDYRERRERHDFLSSQLADLSDAEAQLRAAIDQLNGEIRERFVRTFESVNRSFSEYFSAFFGGGVATLLLTNPDNPAESGIDIEATPPGKKIKSLALLSGGERSLTAVALLFALLTANPAPFCVLDEVDAALDEANVGRFTGALRDLSARTQFLVVTHNRRTVEVADSIYGISMNRDGVSKVLSLRLADLPQD